MAERDLPTRERIIIAAEREFARHAFDGASLRAIAAEARVPVGLINYHFVSKVGLYRAIWVHWLGLLGAPAFGGCPEASLEPRLRAFVENFFNGPRHWLRDLRGKNFVGIMVRATHDPSTAVHGVLQEFLFPSGAVFRQELARLMPNLGPFHLAVGFEMMVAALQLVVEQGPPTGTDLPQAARDPEVMFEILTDFVVSGLLSLGQDRSR